MKKILIQNKTLIMLFLFLLNAFSILYIGWFEYHSIIALKNISETSYERIILQKYVLMDDKLPVSCYGHVLKREISKYQKIGNTDFVEKFTIAEEGPQAVLNKVTSWATASFYPERFLTRSMEIPKGILAERYLKNTPEGLALHHDLPKRVHQLSDFNYFIGNNPDQPSDQDIVVNYTCSSYPPLTVWGVVNDGVLSSGVKGSGVSEFPLVVVQKKHQQSEQALIEFFPFIVLMNISGLISLFLRYLSSQGIFRLNLSDQMFQTVGIILLLGLIVIPITPEASSYLAFLLICYGLYDIKGQKQSDRYQS